METEQKTTNDADDLDKLEFEIFKKYWQPMMKELIALQELKESVPVGNIGTVKKMSDELSALRQGFDELRGTVASMIRPQPTGFQQLNTPYNPGLAHMPLYRSGQSYVVSPVQQPN